MGRVWAVVLSALLVAPAAASAAPIAERPSLTGNDEQIGGPATARPLSLAEAPRPPRHPFMAPNDRSNIHDDAYQTDTADRPGPLGREHEPRVHLLRGGVRVGHLRLARADRDRLRGRRPPAAEAARPGHAGRAGRRATLPAAEPGAGEPVQRLHRRRLLLPRPPRPGGDPHQRRATCSSWARAAAGFAVAARLRPDRAGAADDKLIAAMPDWSGRIWVVVDRAASSVTVDPATGARAAPTCARRSATRSPSTRPAASTS